MNKIVLFACVLVALLAAANAERTLFVDTVFPSATTATLLETLTGDNANVQDASVGTLNLNLPDGLVINTVGPIDLEGSFVSIQSDVSTTINADGNIIADSSDRTSITGQDVTFNVGNDFLLSSRAGNVDLISHTGFTTDSDETFISSDGAVSFTAGSGAIDIFSDDLIRVDATNTDIFGENRVSIFAQHLLALNAGNNLEVVSDNIDLDALGNIDVTSTSSNVQFIGGNQMLFQADFINVDGERGIDVTSRHGLVHLHGDGAANVSGDNINLNARQDSTVWAGNNLFVTASSVQADALKDVQIRGNAIDEVTTSFSVDGGEIIVNNDDDITITLTGGSGDSFTASHHTEIRSSDISVSAGNDITASSDQDIFFTANQERSSSIAFSTTGSTSIDAADVFQVRTGDASLSGNNIQFDAGDDILFRADAGAGDEINYSVTEDATFTAGEDTTLSSQFESILATTLTYVAGASINVNGGSEPDELSTLNVSELAIVGGLQAAIESERNLDIRGSNNWTMTGTGDFLASIYDDISLSISESVSVSSQGDLTISATRFEAIAESVELTASGSLTFTAADEMQFDAARNLFFDAVNSFTWTSSRSVQFDAFDEILIDSASSISGGRIEFEGGVGTEIDGAAEIATQTTEIEVSTSSNGDINWFGNTINVVGGDSVNINGIVVDFASRGGLGIYGSLDNEDGNVLIQTIEGTGHSIEFISSADITIDTNQADPLVDAGAVAINARNTLAETSEGDTSFTADSSISFVVLGDTSIVSSANGSFVSGGDFSITATNGDSYSVDGASVIDIERAITASFAEDIRFVAEGVSFASQGYLLFDNSGAPATADPDFTLSAGDDIIVTAGTFTQTGGDLTNTFGSDTTFYGKERVSFNSYIETYITAATFLFDADNEGDSIRFEARDFFASADADDVNLLGGDISFLTGENQGIFASAASSLLLETNQGNAFTWQTADDFNSTAGAYEIVAHNTSDSNIGVRFMSTHEKGDIVVLSRNGEMRLVAAEDHIYTADRIEMYSAGDMWFANVLRPSSGGITLQAAGVQFDPYYGDDVGASFRASGNDGFIYILPETGAAHFSANEDIGLVSAAGGLTVDAFDVMPFTTTDGGIELFSHWGEVSITADRNNLTMTTPLDSEIRTSANTNLYATDTVRLTAVTDGVLQAVNNIGMEFSVHTGHIQMLADSNEDITWTTPADYHVQSGDQVSITASDDITFTATNGAFDMHGDTGLGYFVRNGDLQLSASDNIHVTSAENEYINVESGFENNWTAQSGSISITSLDAADQTETPVDHAADQTGIAMRTERGDVVFQALDGNIRYLSSGRVQFQADGASNNIAGSDVDGIFLVANEIDSLATHETVWDAEGTVRIGANTNPIVNFEAGGDARASGVTITSEGGANISTQQDFLVSSAGSFGTASVLESDFVVSGDITISSAGTSPKGRNVDFETAGEFDIDANSVDITGQDSVFVSSSGFLQLTSTGNNPTTAFIDFSAFTDMFINVNGTFDVDVDNWTITAETFEALSNGFTSFSNVNGASSGSISVLGDGDVSLFSDVAQSYDSRSGSMTLLTTSSNGDISIEANSATSSVLFFTGGAGESFGFSMSSRDEIDIDTSRSISLTSRDQDEDDDEEGNITLTTSNDFELFASRDLVVEGAKGLTVSTTNPTGTDIDIESDGFLDIVSWEDMEFRSTSQEMTIEVGFDVVFSTHDDQEGSVITTSTRDIIIDAENGSFLDVDGDFALTAGRVLHFQAQERIDFETQGQEAVMSFTAEQGELIIDSDNVIGRFGSLELTATGQAIATVNDFVAFQSHGSHSNIEFESEAGLLTASAGSLTVEAHPTLRLADTDAIEPNGAHGYIEAVTSGTHPTAGYGLRIETAGDVGVESAGHTRFHAPNGEVRMIVDNSWDAIGTAPLTPSNAQLETGNVSGGQLSYIDGNAVYIAAKGPGGNINVTSTESIELIAELNLVVEAANGIEIDTFVTTTFEAGIAIGAEDDFIISSNHPYADLVITATDFLNGEITFETQEMSIYGRFGVVLELQDDDDQNSSGEYDLNADRLFATARNDVVFTVDGGGDIVVDAEDLNIEAGGDLIAEFRNALDFDSDDLLIESFGPVRFDSGEDFDVDIGGDFDVVANGVFINALTGSVALEGDTVTFASGNDIANEFQSPKEDMIFRAGDIMIFESTLIEMATERGGHIDFREGLKIPFINSAGVDRSTTAPCGAVGGNNSFFYDPYFKQFCFCSRGELACQFAYPATFLSV